MKRADILGTSKQCQTACRLRTKLMSMLASVKSLGQRRYAGSISAFSVPSVVNNNSCLSDFVAKIRVNPRLKCLNQIDQIMQNKPNFPNIQINISASYTKDYENAQFVGRRKNKPKQSQFQIVENLIALEAIFGIITESE